MIWSKNRDKDKPKDAALKPGTLFEKYSVVKELGRGGMGAVYLVRHTVLDSLFALKILAPDIAKKNKQFVDRFIREAKLACKIKHPNLIAVHDAGQNPQNGLYYIIMDYVPGGSVRDLLKKTRRIPPGRALEIITQVAGALSAANAHHMVHRDIKPDNIMFTADGSAKLADLGIAKSTDEQDTMLTMASSVFGTPAYMSPEQAKDSSKVDSRADIYSLGIVFYEMLSGKRPFSGDTTIQILSQIMDPESTPDIRQVCPETPQDLADLIARMTEKNLEKRIPDPDTLVQELKKIRIPDQIASRPLRTRGEILVDKQSGNGASAGDVTMPTMATAAPAGDVTMPTMVTAAPVGDVTMPTMATAAPPVSVEANEPEPEPQAVESTPQTVASAPQTVTPINEPEPEPQMVEPEPQTVEPVNEPEPEPQTIESAPQTVASAPQTVASAPQTVASAPQTFEPAEPEPQAPAPEESPEVTMPTMATTAPPAAPAPKPAAEPEVTVSAAPPQKTSPAPRQTAPQTTAPAAKTTAPDAPPKQEEAASPKKSKKGIVVVVAVLAACFVLVLGAGLIGLILIFGDESPAVTPPDPGNKTESPAIPGTTVTAETKPVSGGQAQDVRPEQNTVAASNKPANTANTAAADTEVTPAATTVATPVRTVSETPSGSGKEEDEDEMVPDPLRKNQIVLLSDTSALARDAKKALAKAFGAEKVSFQEAAGMGSYKRELDTIAKASPSAVVICFARQYAEDGISASGYENVIAYQADFFREKGIPILFLQPDGDEDDDRLQPYLTATRDVCQYRSVPLVAAEGAADGKLVSAVRGLLPGGAEN